MPGKTGASLGTWGWKGCKGSVIHGGSPGGDMWGGLSLAALQIGDPLCSGSPSFKGQRVRESGLHCAVAERSCVTVLCVRYSRTRRMGLNHMNFTNIAHNWAYLLHLVSLRVPAPAPSCLFFPGYSRLEKDIATENRCCSWTVQLRSL